MADQITLTLNISANNAAHLLHVLKRGTSLEAFDNGPLMQQFKAELQRCLTEYGSHVHGFVSTPSFQCPNDAVYAPLNSSVQVSARKACSGGKYDPMHTKPNDW